MQADTVDSAIVRALDTSHPPGKIWARRSNSEAVQLWKTDLPDVDEWKELTLRAQADRLRGSANRNEVLQRNRKFLHIFSGLLFVLP